MFEFKTIASEIFDVTIKEKGSKFIGFASPADNLASVKSALEKVKTLHPKATHYCYAFRLGINGENHRANDDGEPSGSAGLPIYNQLISNDLTNILLIVVRYYGGTKLGVPGLVKAYKETAKQTLDAAEILIKEMESTINIQFPFANQNAVFTVLNKFEAKILEFDAKENCTIKAKLKSSQKENISEVFSEMHHIDFRISD